MSDLGLGAATARVIWRRVNRLYKRYVYNCQLIKETKSSRLPEGEGACRWSTRLPSFLPHILHVAFQNHAKSTRIIEKEKGAYEGDKRGLQGEEKEGIISRR